MLEVKNVTKKRIISIFLILLLIIIIKSNIIIPTKANPITNITEQSNTTNQNLTIIAEELISNATDQNSIEHNTSYLQNLIDTVSNAGGGTVHILAGTYYFAPGGNNLDSRATEYYVIKCKDNVTIEGEGTNETTGTILKPIGSNNLPLDMFYYNEYRDTYGKNTKYLENADFKDFVIDGQMATSTGQYNTAGKGFMINLYKDCDWNNIIVKNTDGTGFGMDNPINSTITNCIAIGCGKAATSSDYGASGFGIGFGYSEQESIIISNCKAIGNRKFGFFFEHQGRFSSAYYTARKAKEFIVTNCTASGNMYNFGGERANDVTFKNCKSYETPESNPLNITNASAIYFGTNSRRTHIENCEINQKFTDVTDDSKYYYTPVYWALNNGIVEGGTSNSYFNPTDPCTRAQAITLLWRMAERPGEVLIGEETVNTGFNDVGTNSYYTDAVNWGKEEEIISSGANFYPSNNCTRAEFITMLWRYAGQPIGEVKNNFSDVETGKYYETAVNWAVSKGIIENVENTKFLPNETYTKAEVITILYLFANNININSNSSDNNSTDNSNNTTNSANNSDNNSTDNSNNNTTNSANTNSDNLNNPDEFNNTLDNNTYLKELYLSKGSLKFKKEQNKYTISVPYNIDKLEIIGTPSSSKSIVEGLGEKILKVGENNFTIKVIAENGDIRHYEITITRKEEDNITLDDNNDLKELMIKEYKISFKKDKYNYEIPLNNNSSLNIIATPYSDKADVTIIGNEDLTIGSKIKILVTAENGEVKIYTLTIIEGKNKFSLITSLSVFGISILAIIILLVYKIRKKHIN